MEVGKILGTPKIASLGILPNYLTNFVPGLRTLEGLSLALVDTFRPISFGEARVLFSAVGIFNFNSRLCILTSPIIRA